MASRGLQSGPTCLQNGFKIALDQYDLDEHIANENIRLAQVTNKCSAEGVDNAEDLEYFVREAGEIAGITNELPDEFKNSPKHILHYS